MNHKYLEISDKEKIGKLFKSTFTESEWREEWILISNLSRKLAENIDNKDILCFGTFIDKDLVACMFFSKLYFKTKIKVYLLAPVAVSIKYQKKWIWSSLINFGVNELKSKNTDIIMTYWDHRFYSKVGFEKITEDLVKAPLKLSMPQWWLWKSLKKEPIPIIRDRPSCVKEFNNQKYR